MIELYLLLYVIAAVCFFIFAFVRETSARVNFLGLGIFVWALVPILQTLQKL